MRLRHGIPRRAGGCLLRLTRALATALATAQLSSMAKALQSVQDGNAVLRDVVRLFQQAQRTMTACCSDASRQECEALLLLAQQSGLTVQAFAERMSLEKTWASRLLVRLEKRGLIRRVDHPDDGRSLLVELTAKGRREGETLRSTLNEHALNLMGCVPASERANVERALLHLRDALSTCLAQCQPTEPRDAS